MKLNIDNYIYRNLKDYWIYSIINNSEDAKDYYAVYDVIFLFNRK